MKPHLFRVSIAFISLLIFTLTLNNCKKDPAEKDPCEGRLCKNGGTTYSSGENCACNCTPGYTGDSCEIKNDTILAGEVLKQFQRIRIEEIIKTCNGSPSICNGFDSIYMDTVELVKENLQARVKYRDNSIQSFLLDFVSFSDNEILYQHNYSPHDFCQLRIKIPTDSFYIRRGTGGLAAMLYWDIKGKK
jgi:hypothetical protein